jgi:hypothetical protein
VFGYARRMTTTPIQAITFGRGGNATDFQGAGWSLPEDGYTWSDSKRAFVEIHNGVPHVPLYFEMDAWPFLHESHPVQRMTVKVNGIAIGTIRARDRGLFGFVIPAPVAASMLLIEMAMPDAASPASVFGHHDTRILGFALADIKLYQISEVIPSLVVRPLQHSHLGFESLGDNCEFGAVQRNAGIEPLGLLRFSGQPLRFLIRGLNERFARVSDRDSIVVSERAGEYIVFVRPYEMYYHTFIRATDTTADAILSGQIRRLAFLGRKLIDDIEEASKIFVFKRSRHLPMTEILPLFHALHRIGPATLLIGRSADAAHPPGSVDVLVPGLLAGYLSEFATPGTLENIATDEWRQICDAALDIAGQRGEALETVTGPA